jgi:hypothetical protein
MDVPPAYSEVTRPLSMPRRVALDKSEGSVKGVVLLGGA